MPNRVLDGIKRTPPGSRVLDLGHHHPRRIARVVQAEPKIQPLSSISIPAPLSSLDTDMPNEAAPSLQIQPRVQWRWTLAGLAIAPLVMMATTAALSVTEDVAPAKLESIQAAETKAEQAKTPVAPKPSFDSVLQQKLEAFAASAGGPVGISVKHLGSGLANQISANNVFTSASLYKLFVAKQIYERADIGTLDLDAPSGVAGKTIEQCVKIMIDISDNSCGSALGDKVGWGKQNGALNSEGYVGTSLQALQKTTAADVALLLERLYKGELLEPETSLLYLTHLKQQRVNNRLPLGLPAGTVIAHKTGDLYGYLHDAGIVYSPGGDYVIVMTSGPWKSGSQGVSKFIELSRIVYTHFNP